MLGKQISFEALPSKGFTYPQDIEIYVKPLTAREDMATTLERFGSSKAGYYDNLLNAIEIRGTFDKNKLLFGDIQCIDLYRRLNSFELDESILIKGLKCEHCGKDLYVEFLFKDVEFEDYKEDVFGKEYSFSQDDLKITASPIIIGDFLRIARKYLSNAKKPEDITEYIFAYRAYHVTEAVGRTFESKEVMRTYLTSYFGNLYKNKDIKVLQQLDTDMAAVALPIKVTCSHCEKEVEVSVEPSMRFHQ